MKIVNHLHHLHDLTHLDLYDISCYSDQGDFQTIINNIWNLPKLIYCHLNVHVNKERILYPPTKLSTSLRNVRISGYTLKWNEIYRLFEYTSALKYLSVSVKSNDDSDYKSFLYPTLIDLSIYTFHIYDISKLISFLKNLPNLRRLSVNFSSNLINGYQWKEIIRDYLSNLKVFQLKMKDEISLNENVEERANELINSFRNSFWMDEHKWFVRCFIHDQTIHLETLSKLYSYLEKKLPNWWKSTYPHDDEKKYYSTISSIYHDTFFHHSIPSYIRLHNINFLCIQLPIPDEFWSVVPSLDKLTSLTVSSYTDTFQSQLQTLLDRAQNVHNLQIRQKESLPLQISLFQYTNSSVCQLNLQDCLRLCHSSFGIQCKVLMIQVKNRQSISILVNNMNHLQALHVECKDDQYSKQLLSGENVDESNKDELIQWLIDHFPSCYFIVRDSNSLNCIQIWIQ
ncbi:unnamed protein product [Rotaria sp. Silwood1]|nr:unnamed protein product [Rotaria sp. Silwood1]CAF1633642.1 unnamed protein product [Rotaria sp. Silwood1]